jgi:ribosome biogenesis protein Nip4
MKIANTTFSTQILLFVDDLCVIANKERKQNELLEIFLQHRKYKNYFFNPGEVLFLNCNKAVHLRENTLTNVD